MCDSKIVWRRDSPFQLSPFNQKTYSPPNSISDNRWGIFPLLKRSFFENRSHIFAWFYSCTCFWEGWNKCCSKLPTYSNYITMVTHPTRSFEYVFIIRMIISLTGHFNGTKSVGIIHVSFTLHCNNKTQTKLINDEHNTLFSCHNHFGIKARLRVVKCMHQTGPNKTFPRIVTHNTHPPSKKKKKKNDT